MGQKDWTREEIPKLINVYKEHRFLWNKNDLDYRNRDRKSHAVKGISEIFGCTSDEILRKLHNLRNQFIQELEKVEKGKRTRWPHFESLKFLMPVLVMKSNSRPRVIASQPFLNFTDSTTEAASTSAASSHEQINFKTEQISVEYEQDSNDQEPNNVPTSSNNNTNFKRKFDSSNQNISNKRLLATRSQEGMIVQDECDQFGQYVAMELRSLSSDFNRKRMKSEIRKAISYIADEDLYGMKSAPSPTFEVDSPISASELLTESKEDAEEDSD